MLVDIGSGNGSPAIPLHVVSQLQISHLVEVRAKRAAFLRHVAATLKLAGLQVHRTRFEEVAARLGRADWITLQGVALEPELMESIRQITVPTTTIVWITSLAMQPPVQPRKTLRVPFTDTQVFLFDLS